MKFVCSRLDRRIQYGRARTSILSAKTGSLQLEFFDRVHRWQHDEVCAVQEVHSVRVVVNSVEQVVVLRRTISVCSESTGRRIAPSICLRSVHTCRQLRQKGKISSV